MPKHLIALWTAAALAAAAAKGQPADPLAAAVDRMPRVVLRPEYHPTCRRPLEYIGFSFSGSRAELAAMRANGANAVGLGAMWHPEQVPGAPDGCGYRSPPTTRPARQTFTATLPFDALAPRIPTGTSTDSGCSWRLLQLQADGLPATELAAGTWPLIADNAWPEAEFPVQPPGTYALEIRDPKGSWIGWWVRDGDPYPDGEFSAGDEPFPGVDAELRMRANGAWRDVIPTAEPHRPVHLGPSQFDVLENAGLACNFSVGNWNNPGFNYYPEWFMETFPEAAALDAAGMPVMGGSMFERDVPSPSIESPVIVDGTARFMAECARTSRDKPGLLYWVMGGEELYATYMYRDRWTDYSLAAVVHFRRWLQAFRYGTIQSLNTAWGTAYADFDAVEPPREPSRETPWADWLDFRFATMGERFAWMYRTLRQEDPRRLILTPNHGNIYHDNAYAAMGADYEVYARVSDGFETGQIIGDADPDLYNLMYTETLLGLGKPYCPVRLAYKKSDPKARGGGTSYTPEAIRRYGYESLGAGAWHLGFIQWSGSLPDGEWGMVGTPAEAEAKRFHDEIRALWPHLDDMQAVRPRTAVYVSQRSWALDGFGTARTALHRETIRRGIPKLYLYDGQLAAGDHDGTEVLISVDNGSISPQALRGIAAFLEAGGTLVAAGAFADDRPEQARAILSHPNTVRLDSADPQAICDALPPECEPLPLDGGGQTVPRQREEEWNVHNTDWPQDLHGNAAIGQTFTASGPALRRLSVRMPTFYKSPNAGCTLELRRDGPAGTLIAAARVPAGASDNAWHDLAVPEPPPEGSVLHLAAIPDADLEPASLGWWSTRRDGYPAGTATVNGQPVPGDRCFRAAYDEAAPARHAVETFLLSDGLNTGIVLVNLSALDLTLKPDLAALRVPGLSYALTAPVRPEAIQGPEGAETIRLPAKDGLFLLLAPRIDAPTAARAAEAAGRIAATLAERDALTPADRFRLERTEECLRSNRPAKAAAAALRLAGSLGIAVAVPDTLSPGEDTLRVTVLEPDGSPCREARVRLELTPTLADPVDAISVAPGIFEARILPVLPPTYDYRARAYVPYRGPLHIRVAARAGRRLAARTADVTVNPEKP